MPICGLKGSPIVLKDSYRFGMLQNLKLSELLMLFKFQKQGSEMPKMECTSLPGPKLQMPFTTLAKWIETVPEEGDA